MNSRDKQWRKFVFQGSRKLILEDKLGFFWKIIFFLIAMISVKIISKFVIGIAGIYIGLLIGVLIGVMINVLFDKFLLNSEEIERSAAINSSNVSFKVYINCLIWNVISGFIRLIPVIFIFDKVALLILSKIQGAQISLEKILALTFTNLLITIIMSFIIKILFLPVDYLLIQEKETNFIKAIITSLKMIKEKFLSTILVIIISNIQVWIIGIIAFIGLILSGFGLITILAFLFVVAALTAYYKFIEIKWYKFLYRSYINKKDREE